MEVTEVKQEEYTPDEIEYLNQLSLKEYQAFKIAKQHLESSFSLKKSNGYIQYWKNKNIEKTAF